MPVPRGLAQKLDQRLHQSMLLPRTARLLVACSGGADSVALLCALREINQSDFWKWTLVVGHVNHALRGEESDADAIFVAELAARLGLPAVARTIVWPDEPVHVGEAAARAARRRLLRAMAVETGGDAIVLGHHADDQAETVLMRLMRGAGLKGLGAMRAASAIGSMPLLRPLLTVTRGDLREYLKQCGQPWREDRTNAEPTFLRNRVRAEVMPLLAALQGRVVESLCRAAAHAAEGHDLLRAAGDELEERCQAVRTAEGRVLLRQPLRDAPIAAARYVLARTAASIALDADRVNSGQIDRALTLIRGAGATGRAQIGGGVEIDVAAGVVMVAASRR